MGILIHVAYANDCENSEYLGEKSVQFDFLGQAKIFIDLIKHRGKFISSERQAGQWAGLQP